MRKNNLDEIDTILSVLMSHMPQTVYLVKNKQRYAEVEDAIKAIANFVWSVDESAKITAEPDELTGTSICVEVTAGLVVIDMVDKFCEVLQKANNFEIFPKDDGKIGLGIVFEGAFEPAPPHK